MAGNGKFLPRGLLVTWHVALGGKQTLLSSIHDLHENQSEMDELEAAAWGHGQ